MREFLLMINIAAIRWLLFIGGAITMGELVTWLAVGYILGELNYMPLQMLIGSRLIVCIILWAWGHCWKPARYGYIGEWQWDTQYFNYEFVSYPFWIAKWEYRYQTSLHKFMSVTMFGWGLQFWRIDFFEFIFQQK